MKAKGPPLKVCLRLWKGKATISGRDRGEKIPKSEVTDDMFEVIEDGVAPKIKVIEKKEPKITEE